MIVGASTASTSIVVGGSPPAAPAPAGPNAPSLLTAANATTGVYLTWQDNSLDEVNFELQRSPATLNTWTLIASPAVNAVSYTDTTAVNGTLYDYRIRAVNGSGNSAYATATGRWSKLSEQFDRISASLAGDAVAPISNGQLWGPNVNAQMISDPSRYYDAQCDDALDGTGVFNGRLFVTGAVQPTLNPIEFFFNNVDFTIYGRHNAAAESYWHGYVAFDPATLDGYYAVYDRNSPPSLVLSLYRLDSLVATLIGSYPAPNATAGSRSFGIRKIGTTVHLLLDGTIYATALAQTAHAANTKLACGVYDSLGSSTTHVSLLTAEAP